MESCERFIGRQGLLGITLKELLSPPLLLGAPLHGPKVRQCSASGLAKFIGRTFPCRYRSSNRVPPKLYMNMS